MTKLSTHFVFIALLLGRGAAADGIISSFQSDEACAGAADSVGSEIATNDVIDAMRRGWWACSEKLAESAAASGSSPDMASVVALEARTITGKMSSLRSALESALPPSNIITPAFQWAQSPDALFLNVKFSHKLDAPATLGVSVDSVDFTNDTIKLRASKERKAFQLDIPLRGEIDPSESSWKPGVGGRITLTLKKGPYGPSKKLASRWPNLFATKYKHKGVVQQWWDRAEEYKAALDALSDDDDDADAGAEVKSDEAKAAKGGKGDKSDDDDEDEDDEEEEDKEERALAKKKRQEKAKAQAAKVEAKKKAKEEAKAAKLKEAADKEAAAKANSGEGVAGFLGEALRAIAAEEAAELEAAEAAHKAKKAEITATRDAQLKAINEELAAETARLRADADAKRAALQGNDESDAGSVDAGDEGRPTAVVSAEETGWRAAAAALESAGPVLDVANPGAWAGKEATHAPRVVLGASSSGGDAGATVTVSVGHAPASPGHWVEFMWARALGADHSDLGVVAAQRFPAAEEISAKGLSTAAGASQLALPVSALPAGTAFVTGYAYCNLHGVWRSEPIAIDVAPSAAGSSSSGEL